MACETCRFSETDWVGGYVCRRHPPTAVLRMEGYGRELHERVGREWPPVKRDDWCGEYRSEADEADNA